MNKFQEIIAGFKDSLLAFLQDPQRPMWQRLGAPIGALLLIVLIFSCGSETDDGTGVIRTPEEAMGFAPDDTDSGLGDTATKDEKLLLKLQKKPENKFDIKDLELDEEEGDIDSPLLQEEEKIEESVVAKNTPFSNLSRISPHPMDIAESKDGAIWVADTQGVIQIAKGLEISPDTILTADIFDREFNETMSRVSSIHLADDGSIWVGFFKGEVAQYSRYSWRLLTKAKEPISSRIFDIAPFGKFMFFAGRGLWRWDDSYKRAVGAQDIPQIRVNQLLTSSDNELFAAANNGIWLYDSENHSWKLLWKSRREDGAVTTLMQRRSGKLLVGTSNGIIELSPRGVVTDRLLAGEVITSIVEDKDKNLFVGTRQHGLFYWNGASWFHAAAKEGLVSRIDTLLLDSIGRLWVTASGDGLLVAAASRARSWMEKFPEALSGEQFSEPKIFPSACDAAAGILKGVTLSRNISIEVLDGTPHVFFDGHQVCPKGNGYRRKDGIVVTQDGWSLTVFRERARETIEIPKEYAADKNTAMLLDSKDRLWIGTSDFGVYLHADKKWSVFGREQRLLNNRIRRIHEDESGKIWIASNPSFDRTSRRYSGDPVNVFSDSSVSSFSPATNFGSWIANDIVELSKKRMLFATQNGFTIIHKDGQNINFSAHEKIDPIYTFRAVLDGEGVVWFAHQFFGDGLSWFDGKNFYHAAKKDGLFAEKIVDIAHDRQGRVWLMRSTGQVGVYPRAYLQKIASKLELPGRKHVSLK